MPEFDMETRRRLRISEYEDRIPFRKKFYWRVQSRLNLAWRKIDDRVYLDPTNLDTFEIVEILDTIECVLREFDRNTDEMKRELNDLKNGGNGNLEEERGATDRDS